MTKPFAVMFGPEYKVCLGQAEIALSHGDVKETKTWLRRADDCAIVWGNDQ